MKKLKHPIHISESFWIAFSAAMHGPSTLTLHIILFSHVYDIVNDSHCRTNVLNADLPISLWESTCFLSASSAGLPRTMTCARCPVGVGGCVEFEVQRLWVWSPSGKNVALHCTTLHYTFQTVPSSSSSKTQELRCALKCNHTIDVGLVIRHCDLLSIDFNICYSTFAVESSYKKIYNWDPQKSPPKYINWNWNEHILDYGANAVPTRSPNLEDAHQRCGVRALAGKVGWRQVCICRKQQK